MLLMVVLSVTITMIMGGLIGWVVRGMMLTLAAENMIAEVAFNARQEEMVMANQPCYAVVGAFRGSAIVRTWRECAEACFGMDPQDCRYQSARTATKRSDSSRELRSQRGTTSIMLWSAGRVAGCQ